MARQARLQQLQAELARGLTRVREHQDWQALAQIEAALARELPALARGGPWTGAERTAWTGLCETHARACAVCEDAMSVLQERLQTLSEHREGWLAYAMTDLETPSGAQP